MTITDEATRRLQDAFRDILAADCRTGIDALVVELAAAAAPLIRAAVIEECAKWHDRKAAEWNAELWERRSWGGPTIGAPECEHKEAAHKEAAAAIRALARSKTDE